jgi:folate-dependent tRNA-U54 methylase TrmFO/GidA
MQHKPSISLHTAYQVWYVCLQWKARLLQHTNSQLETFWTLQVRVVILNDGLYQATWYKMDGLNRKRYIRNPILIESTISKFNKTVLSTPQSVLDTNTKILSALSHLFLSILILIWSRKVSLLSKRRHRNLVSGTIFIGGII